MLSTAKEVSASYRADKAKFYASDKKPAKICTKARKRVSALSAFEDRQMLKGLGLL